MNPSPSTSEPTAQSAAPVDAAAQPGAENSAPQPSYVKLAMRNMVRKRGKSLYHFALTTIALLGVLIGLAYLTR